MNCDVTGIDNYLIDMLELYYPNIAEKTEAVRANGVDELILSLSDGRTMGFDRATLSIYIFKPMDDSDDESWRDEFANRLRRRIRISGKTQTDIARVIGVSQSSMSNYINGSRIPDARIMSRLARALGCPVRDLTDYM